MGQGSACVSVRDVLAECAWQDPPGTSGYADAHGYSDGARMIDWFDGLSVDTAFPSREATIRALRAAYKGPDVDGVGVVIPDR